MKHDMKYLEKSTPPHLSFAASDDEQNQVEVVEFIFECASLLHDVWLDLLVF
jgi:hypothetical protein